MVELNIFVFSHPVTGTPQPFILSVSTIDGAAGISINHSYTDTLTCYIKRSVTW